VSVWIFYACYCAICLIIMHAYSRLV
jgi:hypothetical protein